MVTLGGAFSQARTPLPGGTLCAMCPQPIVGPRLFGIPATAAPVVAVIRRGPAAWCHLGRWDLTGPVYEPGSWIKGTIYPQKCDLSSDGRWFAYSILKANTDWAAGDIYEAVSRLPWLTALAAWNAGTTYTRGFRFSTRRGESVLGVPDVGDDAPLLAKYGLDLYRPVQFAVERHRGWTESADTPPRPAGRMWDERRKVTMVKPDPATDNGVLLTVSGGYAAFRTMRGYYEPAEYAIEHGNDLTVLDDVQWADWDRNGRLLVATADGRLQIRTFAAGRQEVVWEEDLAPLRPEPEPPPSWAAEY